MDNIDNQINQWLLQCETIQEIAEIIHTEELTDETGTIALQRSGVENLPLKYITDTGWYRQYQYILLIKCYSEDDSQRLNNLNWLDKLNNWIDNQKEERNFPMLENKQVKDISCANAITYETDEKGEISTYYLQLYFNIKGGK